MLSAGFNGRGVFTGALPEASVNVCVPQDVLGGICVFSVLFLLTGGEQCLANIGYARVASFFS